MKQCSDIVYPVRAVPMPLVPVEGWTGLCLKTHGMFETLGMQNALGRCNCVL